MADVATSTVDKPAWVDLSTTNPKAAREFYAKVFAWDIEVSADPRSRWPLADRGLGGGLGDGGEPFVARRPRHRMASSFSDRCSASMIVTMCGNPDGASGMIEASMTLSRSVPCTLPRASTTSPLAGDGPMAHVPTTCGIEYAFSMTRRRSATGVDGSAGGGSFESRRISGRSASSRPSR